MCRLGRAFRLRIGAAGNAMTRRIVWLSVLALAVLVIGTAWFLTEFEQVPVKHRTGEQLEARRNPYLALERFLEQMGRPLTRVSRTDMLDQLSPNGVLILDCCRRSQMSPQRVDRLLAWVAAGGYLMMVPEADSIPDPLLDRLGVVRSEPETDDDESTGPAADAGAPNPDDQEDEDGDPGIGEEIPDGDEAEEGGNNDETFDPGTPAEAGADGQICRPDSTPDIVTVTIPHTRPLTATYRRPSLWSTRIEPEWSAGGDDGSGAQWLHLAYGQGQITIAAGWGRSLQNRRIGDHDHAELLWALLQAYRPDPAQPIVLATRMNVITLWDWLIESAWPAVAALAIWLGIWLWHRLPRFGPVQPEAPPDRRELREHLAAVGRYLWRAGGLGHWLGIARESFLTRLGRRHPALLDLAPAEQANALAQLSGHSSSLIMTALHEPVASPQSFILALRTLRNLEHSL